MQINEISFFQIEPSYRDLKELSQEIESIFLYYLLKELQRPIFKEQRELLGYSNLIYQDMMMWEYARVLAKNFDFGIANMIYEQFKENVRESMGDNKLSGRRF